MTLLLASAFALVLVCGCGGDSFSAGQGGTDAAGGSGADGGRPSSGGSGQAGKGSGGDTSQGNTGSGGEDEGGAPSTTTCQADQDCVACAYDRAPKTALNCYCVGCPDTPMNVTSCNANQEQYEKVCALSDITCAPIKCAEPEPVYCVKGRCANAQ